MLNSFYWTEAYDEEAIYRPDLNIADVFAQACESKGGYGQMDLHHYDRTLQPGRQRS